MSYILTQPTITTPFTYQLIIDHQLLVSAHLLHLPGGGGGHVFTYLWVTPYGGRGGGALPLEAA